MKKVEKNKSARVKKPFAKPAPETIKSERSSPDKESRNADDPKQSPSIISVVGNDEVPSMNKTTKGKNMTRMKGPPKPEDGRSATRASPQSTAILHLEVNDDVMSSASSGTEASETSSSSRSSGRRQGSDKENHASKARLSSGSDTGNFGQGTKGIFRSPEKISHDWEKESLKHFLVTSNSTARRSQIIDLSGSSSDSTASNDNSDNESDSETERLERIENMIQELRACRSAANL